MISPDQYLLKLVKNAPWYENPYTEELKSYTPVLQ